MKSVCQTLLVPRLIVADAFESPMSVGEKSYFAWQIFGRIQGKRAAQYLQQINNIQTLSTTLARALYDFHNAGDVVAKAYDSHGSSGYVCDECDFRESRISGVTENFHKLSPSMADVALMKTLETDLEEKYAQYDHTCSKVLHGDLTTNNFHVDAVGRVVGIMDASICRAPVETEFFPLARHPNLMFKAAKAYGYVSQSPLDMDFVFLASTAAQLHFSKIVGPERLSCVAACLNVLGDSALPQRSFYRHNAQRLMRDLRSTAPHPDPF